MLQVVQSLGSGSTQVLEVPDPALNAGSVLISTTASLISAGTERMLVEFGRSSLIEKARQQPEKVRQVLDRVRTDGLLVTLDAVRSKLDQSIPLGYCNVGRVLAVGPGVQRLAIGDLVVSNGPHAEIVRVPENLCARVPDGVDAAAATFAVVTSVALQGVRLATPTLGETFVVIGLGLLGQLAVQVLRANGCRVLGVDPDPDRRRLAETFGATVISSDADVVTAAMTATLGRGVDGAIVTAATDSSAPIRDAAKMCRKRGRIVLVGVTGLALQRSDFYEKELTFQVSCSYGPGRYDPQYEEQGHDYPLGFVRWTAQRNFEASLELLASGRLNVLPLITHRFDLRAAPAAYDLLVSDGTALAILLQYPPQDSAGQAAPGQVRSVEISPRRAPAATAPVIAVIGAGNYAARTLLPALAAMPVELHTLVNSGSVQGASLARKFSFRYASTDLANVLGSTEVDTVVIATRHDTHGALAARALRAGKSVFVEKPLALSFAELEEIETLTRPGSQSAGAACLTVGFNRRFAPTVKVLKQMLAASGAIPSFIYTVNAGGVPDGHWTVDPAVGGGRLVGEACHFVDLLRYLADAAIESCCVYGQGAADVQGTLSIGLRFANGAAGTVHYLTNGHPSFPKERLEVFCGGSVAQLDNFRTVRTFGARVPSGWGIRRQDKGHRQCLEAFMQAVRSGSAPPIPLEQIFEVSRTVLLLANLWQVRDPSWVQPSHCPR